MFYYGRNYKLPTKGMIVVATIDRSTSSENCVYVTLPEFGNFSGIFYKNELPTRIKLHKKAAKEIIQNEYIVCTVTNNTKFRSDGHPDMIELSIKGIDQKRGVDHKKGVGKKKGVEQKKEVNQKYHENTISRFKNIEKILKLV